MAKAMPDSRPLPARCWGAFATPPAALTLQQQQGPRERRLRRSLSPPAPPAWCTGAGRRHVGVGGDAASPLVARKGGDRVVLALSAAESGGDDKDDGDTDIWRGSVLRYAGYANEVGESFRNIAPGLVVPSYAVSLAYVVGDTVDKGYKDYSHGKGVVAVGKVGLDVLLWQTLASVAVPGLTINMAVRAVTAAMESGQAKRVLSKAARKWTPTAVGLGIIPFIVHPIDEAVTWGMDETVRKWLA